MSFFAILIALLLEQARPLSADNPVQRALRAWARWLRRSLDAGQTSYGWLIWALAAVTPALLAALLYWGLAYFSALLALGWLVAVLYVTLGLRQFSHQLSDVRQALEAGDEDSARQRFSRWLRVEPSSLAPASLLRRVIAHAVLTAHRQVFGVLVAFVLFWMLGLGPAGALFYCQAQFLAHNWRARPDGTPSAALQHAAARAWVWVDWLPARLTALAFAVVGNFEEAAASCRGDTDRYAADSDGVVLAASSGALNVGLSTRDAAAQRGEDVDGMRRAEPQLAHLGGVLALVWRAVVLWMLLLALLTLAQMLA